MLKVTIERTPESEAVLNVELEWSELEKASDRAYRKLVQKYNVPGFRRGHAPRVMLERMLGKDALYEEGLEDLVEESVRSAVREHHLRPLARASVDTPPIEHGQPYAFTARLPILSPVELGDYKSVRVERPAVGVTDEDVQRVLDDIQQDKVQWLPAERPAEIGDRVTVDLNVTSGDRAISDLHDNEFELTSERHGIYSGMDAQIAGMQVGESKEFTTTIPEDYANTELAGKEAHFIVTLKGVKYRELPALDDELALSLGYDTLEAMRQTIREQLLERKRGQAESELRDKVATDVAEQAKVDIHEVLVDDEVHAMMREMERTLSQSHLTLERYLELTNKTEEQYHKELEPEASQRVRRNIVLSAVADAEDIDVPDQELSAWLDLIAAAGGGRAVRLRQLSPEQRETLRSRLRREKALDRLVEIATEGQAPPEAAAGDNAASAHETPTERGAQAAAAVAASLSAQTTDAEVAPEPEPEAADTAGMTAGMAQTAQSLAERTLDKRTPDSGMADTSAAAALPTAPSAPAAGPDAQAESTSVPAPPSDASSTSRAGSAGAPQERASKTEVDTEVPESPDSP